MKTQFFALPALLAASVLLGPAANAQIRELDETQRGSGRVNLSGWRDNRIDQAQVVLRRDGRAEIRFHGDARHSFGARWTPGRSDVVELRDLTGNFGRDRATGDGRVYVSRYGGFDRVTLSGSAGGRRFSIDFTSNGNYNNGRGGGLESRRRDPLGGIFGRRDRNDDRYDDRNDDRYDDRYGRNGTFRETDETQRGTGSLIFSGDRDERLREATVTLRRDGTALIRFRGDSWHTFVGRWTHSREGWVADLNLQGDFGRDSARATGRAWLRPRGGFERVEISGTAGGRRFTFRFDGD